MGGRRRGDDGDVEKVRLVGERPVVDAQRQEHRDEPEENRPDLRIENGTGAGSCVRRAVDLRQADQAQGDDRDQHRDPQARLVERLGGQKRVRQLIGGPWAIRYTLSHLVKDEAKLSKEDWARTYRVLAHGSLAAGFLTGNFDACSISSAASTGIMDLRTGQWRREMLDALGSPELRELAWNQLPTIIDQNEPVGALRESLALEIGMDRKQRPLIFPTSDDQQAGLIGGGAVEAGRGVGGCPRTRDLRQLRRGDIAGHVRGEQVEQHEIAETVHAARNPREQERRARRPILHGRCPFRRRPVAPGAHRNQR